MPEAVVERSVDRAALPDVLAALTAPCVFREIVADWPLVAAVSHTGGAAALVAVFTWAVCASRVAPASLSSPSASSAMPAQGARP